MLSNVMHMAFDTATSLVARIELLETFHLLAKRDVIKRHVEKRTSELYSSFLAEINVAKKRFDLVKRTTPSHPYYPPFAAQTRQVATLQRRLNTTWAVLQVSQPNVGSSFSPC